MAHYVQDCCGLSKLLSGICDPIPSWPGPIQDDDLSNGRQTIRLHSQISTLPPRHPLGFHYCVACQPGCSVCEAAPSGSGNAFAQMGCKSIDHHVFQKHADSKMHDAAIKDKGVAGPCHVALPIVLRVPRHAYFKHMSHGHVMRFTHNRSGAWFQRFSIQCSFASCSICLALSCAHVGGEIEIGSRHKRQAWARESRSNQPRREAT